MSSSKRSPFLRTSQARWGDMAHPSVIRSSEPEVLPVHRFRITEEMIYNTESGHQARITIGCRLEIGLSTASSHSSLIHLCWVAR